VKLKAEQVAESVTVDLARQDDQSQAALRTNLRANAGFSMTAGNTDTQDIYTDAEFMARSLQNRYTMGGFYKRSEDDNVKTEYKGLGYLKYDHFFTKKWYGVYQCHGRAG